MEEQAQNLIATLKRTSVATDAKIAAFNSLKSNIKHLRVPEAAQPTVFECIKLAISSQASPTLVSTGFSTLGHLIKRLVLQEQTNVIAAQAKRLLPILLDRLGDARESHRNAASQCIADIWPYSHVEAEQTIREGALSGHNARTKEMGMLWVVSVRRFPDRIKQASNFCYR
jgi:CLIP-associating protein 1/2